MPTYVSKRGEWSPAKEKIGLTNKSDEPFEYNGQMIQPGEPFIYDGPCRGAIKELANADVDVLGQDFKADPEFLQMIRSRGFNDMEEYLKFVGYDEEADEKSFNEKAAKVKGSEIKKRAEAIKVLAGGQASNREESIVGGFGDQKMKPASDK
jgi:hypothetical protein